MLRDGLRVVASLSVVASLLVFPSYLSQTILMCLEQISSDKTFVG